MSSQTLSLLLLLRDEGGDLSRLDFRVREESDDDDDVEDEFKTLYALKHLKNRFSRLSFGHKTPGVFAFSRRFSARSVSHT